MGQLKGDRSLIIIRCMSPLLLYVWIVHRTVLNRPDDDIGPYMCHFQQWTSYPVETYYNTMMTSGPPFVISLFM